MFMILFLWSAVPKTHFLGPKLFFRSPVSLPVCVATAQHKKSNVKCRLDVGGNEFLNSKPVHMLAEGES